MRYKQTKNYRPWWWFINPWLYIQRRDMAYDIALNTLQELSESLYFHRDINPVFNSCDTKKVLDSYKNKCITCGRHYQKIVSERIVRERLETFNKQ